MQIMRSRPAAAGTLGYRPAILGLGRILGIGLSAVTAAPLEAQEHHHHEGDGEYEPSPDGTPVWVLLVASIALVLLGGVFAGLTIALMGQDSIYLQVVSGDPTEPQQKNAKRVLQLLKRGKHWVLVTLLLANVIVNESLPVVLDRTLGGGIAAVVGSTVLIAPTQKLTDESVIFGEVVPQSVCVRYGLPIGGFMSKPVLGLMYLLGPVAWPTAKLLDWILGEDHGTVYKKSGLKTLVTLHKSLGELSERLNQDEVTIISSVLDLKDKPVSEVMTPMGDVFTMSEDHILDEKTMDKILSLGYSRIPIYRAGNPTDFVGIMLVKTLITYDPEDRIPVREVPLGAIVETRPETSCLDIINFFQEGKSHMVLVSEVPGADHGALGVVTLEDVIEELIGEEIVDESDVYVDVHKAIRRLAPAPRVRRIQAEAAAAAAAVATVTATGRRTPDPAILVDILENEAQNGETHVGSYGAQSDTGVTDHPPKTAVFMKRRRSAGPDGGMDDQQPVPVRSSLEEVKRQFRLGPANNAAHPLNTRGNVFKIKQGLGTPLVDGKANPRSTSAAERPRLGSSNVGETAPLLGRHHNSSGSHLGEGYGSSEALHDDAD
ncbi:Protein MAM3 [Paramyrothecium foliicola]|nr:Protein MAM3 [Paramyrothecium foliicola]